MCVALLNLSVREPSVSFKELQKKLTMCKLALCCYGNCMQCEHLGQESVLCAELAHVQMTCLIIQRPTSTHTCCCLQAL